MDRFDAIVIGLGGMGSAALDALAGRGQRVLGLEQFELGHSRGSGHGRTRIVRQAYFENPAYIPLLRRAYQLWDGLPAEAGLQRVGCLSIGAADSPVVSGAIGSAAAWHIAVQQYDGAGLGKLFPQFALRPDDVAVFEPDAGFVRPEQTIAVLQARARHHGAALRSQQRVLRWELDGTDVLVRTEQEVHRSRRLVITAGAWTARLGLEAVLPVQVQRRVMYFFRPAAASGQGGGAGMPTFIWELGTAGRSDAIYGFPADGDAGLKIGFHDRGGVIDPDREQAGASAAEQAAIRAVVADRLPAATGDLIRSVPCHYDLTPDRDFVIGSVPGTDDRVVVGAGFSGHGFKFVPVVGEVLADLVINGGSRFDLDFLSPGRFAGGVVLDGAGSVIP